MNKTKPPHLRISYNPDKNCGHCAWYHPVGLSPETVKAGHCAMYKGFAVFNHEVCDTPEWGVPGSKGKIKVD